MNTSRQAANPSEAIRNRFPFLDWLNNSGELGSLLVGWTKYSLLSKEKLHEVKNPKVREVIDRLYNYILPLCVAVAAENNIDILRDTQWVQFGIYNDKWTESKWRITIDYNEYPFISAYFTAAQDFPKNWDYNWEQICAQTENTQLINWIEDVISQLIHRRNIERRWAKE